MSPLWLGTTNAPSHTQLCAFRAIGVVCNYMAVCKSVLFLSPSEIPGLLGKLLVSLTPHPTPGPPAAWHLAGADQLFGE